MVPINTDIVLEIHCPKIDDELQTKIKKSIKNNYGMEIDDNEYDLRDNYKKAFILGIIGLFFLIISLWIEKLGRIIADFICVVWWVAIWDMVGILMVENREIKWKRLNNQQLYDSDIKFIFDDETSNENTKEDVISNT